MKTISRRLYEKIKLLIIATSKILLECRKSKLKRRREIALLLLDCEKEISELPEVRACAETMISDVAIATNLSLDVGISVEKLVIEQVYVSYLRSFLFQYFQKVNDIVFDKEVFGLQYAKFEEYLYSDSIKYIIIAPLAGFKNGVDVIELQKNLRIRRTSKEEIDRLGKPRHPFLPSIIDPMDASALKYALEASFSHRKGSPENIRIIDKEFEGVVTVLRLFKSGTVDFFFTQQMPLLWSRYGGIAYRFKKRSGYLFLNYNLGKEEVDDFVELWKELGHTIVNEDFHGHKYLRIAVIRFNLGSEEKDLENKLIDFFVAFEALLLLETLELSYKLALRTATLLGESPKEKKEIFNFMREAYVLRSRIVHGKIPKIRKKIIDLKDYVPRLEDYLRRSIVKYLRMTIDFANQKDILDSLNQKILE